jgi:hypothetical protein
VATGHAELPAAAGLAEELAAALRAVWATSAGRGGGALR